MSDTVISVENLGKQYRLRHLASGGYRTFREMIAEKVAGLLRPARRLAPVRSQRSREEEFWALRNVSFQVKRGEVVGIVGRNGAGKSTLLKLLSRITQPTEGRVRIQGRVASLLEVGTGFHPELTGRENIFLNGAILGMGRREIRAKFEEIVAFAEVNQFVDTPVKRYSSGMYLRLAFSVAAHLEPEILVVDEVLAVGDAAFQKKCINRMNTVAETGRTVLFVSHNLSAVRRLCQRGILLKQGGVGYDGDVEGCLGEYIWERKADAAEYVQATNPTKRVNLRKAALLDSAGEPCAEVDYAAAHTLTIEYEVNQPTASVGVWFAIWNTEETLVLGSSDYDLTPELLQPRAVGLYRAAILLPPRILNVGNYYFVVGITGQSPTVPFDRVEAIHFSVVDSSEYLVAEQANRPGLFKPQLPWNTVAVGPHIA